MTRPTSPIPPITMTEFLACTVGVAFTIWAIGIVMGVQWFG